MSCPCTFILVKRSGLRLNYVLWLQDIVDATYFTEPPGTIRAICGVDMYEQHYSYCRSSCLCRGTVAQEPPLYTLFWGVSPTHDGHLWPQVSNTRCATAPTHYPIDVDERSLEYAQRNVRNNCLDTRIDVVRSDPTGPVFGHVLWRNPPAAVGEPG